jgi:hypothetical protein
MIGITFTKQMPWHYVIDMVAVHAACLAYVAVTLQNALTYLSPLTSRTIVLQCAGHQYHPCLMCHAHALH